MAAPAPAPSGGGVMASMRGLLNRGTSAQRGNRKSAAATLLTISHTVARAHQLEMHPSYLPPGETVRKRYPVCMRTGRYCTRVCGRFDPFCEGTVSELSAYGSGVTSYFKTLKWLSWVFGLIAILSIPAITINSNGSGETVLQSTNSGLGRTTLGNLASLGNATHVDLPGGHSVSKTAASWVYAFCDLAGAIIFLISIPWVKRMERVEAFSVEKEVVTVEDYSVYFPRVPPNVTENDLRVFCEKATRTRENPAGYKVAMVMLVKDNMKLVDLFIRRGSVFKQLERLGVRIAKLRRLAATASLASTTPTRSARAVTAAATSVATVGCCGTLATRIERLRAKRDKLLAVARQLSSEATKVPHGGTVAAFVTFDNRDAVPLLLTDYPDSLMRYLCQPRRQRLFGTHRVSIEQAPPPSTVLWSNLNKYTLQKAWRRFATSIAAIVLLGGSLVMLYFASYLQSKVQAGDKAIQCTQEPYASALVNGNLSPLYIKMNNFKADDLRTYCVCSTLGWATMPFSQLKAVTNPLDWKLCPSQTCPRILASDPTAITHEPACSSYLLARTQALALQLSSSVAIVVINVLLSAFMRFLTRIEAHHSLDGLNRSLSMRLFAAQFLNTAVLTVLVNAPLDKYVNLEIKTAKYDDMDPGWYSNVGSSLMVTMLMNVIMPHIMPALRYSFWLRRQQRTKTLDVQSQRDLNARYVGPASDYALRFAQVWNTVFVCYVFSTGMPLMNFIAFGSLALSYWADKFFFIRFYRRPPAYINQLAKRMTSLLPIAILLHLAIGCWQLGNHTSIFGSKWDPVRLNEAISNALAKIAGAVPPSVTAGAERVTRPEVLPLFVLFGLMVVVFTLYFLFSFMGACAKKTVDVATCGVCARVQAALDRAANEKLVVESGGDDGAAAARKGWVPTYTQAISERFRGTPFALQGIPSYSMLQNPLIAEAFAITPEFARMHRSLSSVALYKVALRKDSRENGNNSFLVPDMSASLAQITGRNLLATGRRAAAATLASDSAARSAASAAAAAAAASSAAATAAEVAADSRPLIAPGAGAGSAAAAAHVAHAAASGPAGFTPTAPPDPAAAMAAGGYGGAVPPSGAPFSLGAASHGYGMPYAPPVTANGGIHLAEGLVFYGGAGSPPPPPPGAFPPGVFPPGAPGMPPMPMVPAAFGPGGAWSGFYAAPHPAYVLTDDAYAHAMGMTAFQAEVLEGEEEIDPPLEAAGATVVALGGSDASGEHAVHVEVPTDTASRVAAALSGAGDPGASALARSAAAARIDAETAEILDGLLRETRMDVKGVAQHLGIPRELLVDVVEAGAAGGGVAAAAVAAARQMAALTGETTGASKDAHHHSHDEDGDSIITDDDADAEGVPEHLSGLHGVASGSGAAAAFLGRSSSALNGGVGGGAGAGSLPAGRGGGVSVFGASSSSGSSSVVPALPPAVSPALVRSLSGARGLAAAPLGASGTGLAYAAALGQPVALPSVMGFSAAALQRQPSAGSLGGSPATRNPLRFVVPSSPGGGSGGGFSARGLLTARPGGAAGSARTVLPSGVYGGWQ